MKQTLLTIALMLLPMLANAEISTFVNINNIYYNLDTEAKTAEVTYNYNNTLKYSGTVVIPEKVENGGTEYRVTSIGEQAFIGCFNLISVTIPNSVTSIGDNAFNGCLSLNSVNIPDGVTYIGHQAFSECSRLTSIDIPNSVTTLETYAFNRCI